MVKSRNEESNLSTNKGTTRDEDLLRFKKYVEKLDKNPNRLRMKVRIKALPFNSIEDLSKCMTYIVHTQSL